MQGRREGHPEEYIILPDLPNAGYPYLGIKSQSFSLFLFRVTCLSIMWHMFLCTLHGCHSAGKVFSPHQLVRHISSQLRRLVGSKGFKEMIIKHNSNKSNITNRLTIIIYSVSIGGIVIWKLEERHKLQSLIQWPYITPVILATQFIATQLIFSQVT